jgi:hypothetical protein
LLPDSGTNSVLQVTFILPALVASILPGSRSVQLGTTATVFGDVINITNTTLDNCGIEMPVTAFGDMVFQTTNPVTNALTGTPNAPVSIPPGDVQSFAVRPGHVAHLRPLSGRRRRFLARTT